MVARAGAGGADDAVSLRWSRLSVFAIFFLVETHVAGAADKRAMMGLAQLLPKGEMGPVVQLRCEANSCNGPFSVALPGSICSMTVGARFDEARHAVFVSFLQARCDGRAPDGNEYVVASGTTHVLAPNENGRVEGVIPLYIDSTMNDLVARAPKYIFLAARGVFWLPR
jgi:hypothetical protein